MIKARVKAENPNANLKAYSKSYRSFSWADEERIFSWHGSGDVNIVHEAIDRWAARPDKQNQKALIFEKRGEVRTFTYLELKEKSCQWANLLVKYGFKTGDRLFIFLPHCPEIYFALLACARLGVLFCTLSPTLSFDELEVRLENGEPLGILSHPDLAERIPFDSLKGVKHIFLLEGPVPGQFSGEVLVENLTEQMSSDCKTRWLSRRTPLYLNYTSGSTGTPKGVIHTHNDMVGILTTARSVLDLHDDSLLWTEANPGWITGTVYGAFAPWLCGITTFIRGDPFSASNIYRALEKHGVSVWYTTPTTIRRLIEAGEDLPRRYDFSNLRHIATVGEPLIPELFYWVMKNFGLSPHDTWWMTETGMICLANFPSMDIKPGSLGKPVPGIELAVVDDEGSPLPPMSMGELALKVGWPGLMSALWKDEKRYKEYFRREGWFLTGDMVVEDEEGYFYHQGRNDDLLKVGSDKLVGPYEVERVLYMHPAVSEAVVISKGGNPGTGKSFVKAFITVNDSFSVSARLNQEIKAFVKANLSPDILVTEIDFIDNIPKTSSGKVLRRVLRARELGLPAGGDAPRLKD
jgi:acetyl-CoA synthetase